MYRDDMMIFGKLSYFLDNLGHCDILTDGATRYCKRVFFYGSNDVCCVLGRIFSGFSGYLADYVASCYYFTEANRPS